MHVYLFSPIPYSFLHQRPQKLADQFAALSYSVTFIEPCGLTEYLAGRKRGLIRLVLSSVVFQVLGLLALVIPALGAKPRTKERKGSPSPGIRCVSMPIVIPVNRVDSPYVERLNAAVYRQTLRWRVFRTMGKDEQSVALVENPYWGSILRKGDFTKVAYDCLDEISLFSGRASSERFAGYERDVLQLSDAVFVTAERLEEDLHSKGIGPAPVRVPNGVDYEWFRRRAREGETPADLQNIKRPLIGYMGILRDWFDYDLVGALAREALEFSFVMVGPLDFENRIAHLRGIPNLFWLGRKEYQDVPLYVNAFDVCLIPFRSGKISMTTNPVKVFEYFALGKPVVSTPLFELKTFGDQGLLRLADSKDSFAAAVRQSLAESDPETAMKREEVARKHSWKELTYRMMSAILASPGRP